MPDGLLFIVTPADRKAKVTAYVHEIITPKFANSFKILTDSVNQQRDGITAGIINQISAYPPNANDRLIIDRETRCRIGELENWWRDRAIGKANIQKLAPATVLRTIKAYFENRGYDWRIHALREIEKFDGPTCSLNAWLQQFSELGSTAVGRKIAAMLRVIRPNDLSGQPYFLKEPDIVGQRQARCYVQDDDPGGSWLEMQAILTHAYPPETVCAALWNAGEERLKFPIMEADEIVVYEDGLWSGKEAVGRLRAIASAPPSVPVIFRFGVVTDFGLMVVRQSIRSFELAGRVSVDASSSEYIRFLHDDIPENLRLGFGLQPEEYYQALHKYVKPYAFEGGDWTVEEIETCRELGAQLTRHWLQDANSPAAPAKIDTFALGGGGFASTMIFSHGAPKVCLPLLWLNGPITLAGKCLDWKPLFVDARRVSDNSLLLAYTREKLT